MEAHGAGAAQGTRPHTCAVTSITHYSPSPPLFHWRSTDIADDFKIVVVEAIRSLCLKFPAKHRALMNFLSSVLREEGGFEYKKAIVNSILVLIQVGSRAAAQQPWRQSPGTACP